MTTLAPLGASGPPCANRDRLSIEQLINQLIVLSEMIKNFSDHSANERTFLAWVRTAIAVMAFGFLIEKFDLFLKVAAPSVAQRMSLLPSHELGSVAGLMFVVLGLAMIVLAAARFAFNAKSIDRAEQVPGTGSRIDLALALLLVLLGCSMFFYLAFSL